MALGQGLSLNKFSTTKNIGQSVQSVANQTTQSRMTGLGGRIQTKKAKGNQSPKNCQIRLEKRRQIKRGRAKKRHQ